jgi:eukaryotic-like serine/threonine-protein kinase
MLHDVTDQTRHVPDGPDAARAGASADPSATRAVPDGPLAANATRDLRTGSDAGDPSTLPRFGRFIATAKLGAGGMGTVFRAHDDVLGRDVAIKSLHDPDPSVRERFVREARAIGAVLHPNILGVYDAGEASSMPFIVMELATLGSLRDRIQSGPLAIEEVRQIGIQIARALAAAHDRGIVHRDVKPGNILSTQPATWKLADFGIARLPDSTLTVSGQFLGSPSYAAPESLRAGEFSAASDVYSLGATLYEALAGAPPFGDHDMQSVIRKLDSDPPQLSTKRAVPGPLGAAIMSAVQRDPALRPSAEVLAGRLADTSNAAFSAPVVAPVAATAPAVAAGSHRMKLVALALAAIAGVAIVLALKSSSDPPKQVPGVTRPIAAPVAEPDDRETNQDPPDDEESGIAAPQPPEAPSAPSEPAVPGADGETPTFVDQFGNRVDDETAQRLLEQMQRDAESSFGGRGRGHGKKKKRE